jgi:hypothetical protein
VTEEQVDKADAERLRDTFAAAALPLCTRNGRNAEQISESAYKLADAMLCERGRHHIPDAGKMVENTTNHDAAPEARAYADGEPAPKRGGEAGISPRDGTGNTPSKAEIDALEFVVEEGRTASIDDYGILRSWLIRLRPEWESQSYEESNEKRMNTTTNRDATPGEVSVQGEGTLTDAEREAIAFAAEHFGAFKNQAATLRWLLERLHT